MKNENDYKVPSKDEAYKNALRMRKEFIEGKGKSGAKKNELKKNERKAKI